MAATEPTAGLGLFHLPLRGGAGEPVYGAAVAARGFQRALLAAQRSLRCELFVPGGAEAEAAAQDLAGALRGVSAPAPFRVHDLFRMDGAALRRLGLLAWHDGNADAFRPFQLRAGCPGLRLPITVAHHSFSYPRMLHEWFLPLLTLDVRESDAILCSSRAARAAIAALLQCVAERFNRQHGARLRFRGRLEVLPLGVDTELFRPRDRADARRQVGLPQEPLVLLWLGRFSEVDKADLAPLLRVYARLRRRHPRAELLLALCGNPVGRAGALAEYALHLGLRRDVAIVDASALPSHLLYAAADVFVSPADSLQEAFGLAPLEAMACGVPQVVADWDGYRDTVAHGETGLRVPTLWARCDGDLGALSQAAGWEGDHLRLAQSVAVDLDALEAALDLLLREPALRARMGEASRARAVAEFSWPRVLSRHEALWRELAAVAARAPAPRSPPGYATMPYSRAFAAYPSRWLAPGTALQLTEEGRAVRAGAAPLPVTPGAQAWLDVALAERLLGALRPVQTRTAGRLLAEGDPRGARPRATRHLLWLLKQGLLRVSSSAPPRRPRPAR